MSHRVVIGGGRQGLYTYVDMDIALGMGLAMNSTSPKIEQDRTFA